MRTLEIDQRAYKALPRMEQVELWSKMYAKHLLHCMQSPAVKDAWAQLKAPYLADPKESPGIPLHAAQAPAPGQAGFQGASSALRSMLEQGRQVIAAKRDAPKEREGQP